MSIKIKRAAAFLLTLPVFLWLCFSSCDIKSTNPDPTESFSKIYDKANKSNYTAVDIKQTENGGYIILGVADNHPYLLKTSGDGSFQWDTANNDVLNSKKYINPIAKLLVIDQEYYFFCNELLEGNEIYKAGVLLKVNNIDNIVNVEKVTLSGEISLSDNLRTSLLSASQSDDHFLLVFYNELVQNLLVGKVNCLGENVMNKYGTFYGCTNLYPFEDKRFHIFGTIGNMGKRYHFIQTYMEHNIAGFPGCFRLITIGPPDITPFKDNFQKEPFYYINPPFIAMELDGTDWNGTDWNGLTISGARIDDHIVSFFLKEELDNVGDRTEGNPEPELIASKPVYIKAMDINSQPFVLFAGSAKNNRIALYVYGWSNGVFQGKRYFGHTHIYEAAGLIDTTNGGLAILGTTYVAGRLGRICLFKLSNTDLEDILNNVTQ